MSSKPALTLYRKTIGFSGGYTHYVDDADKEWTLCHMKILQSDVPKPLILAGKVVDISCEKCKEVLLASAEAGPVVIARVKNVKPALENFNVPGEVTPVANRKEFAVEAYSGGPVKWYDTFLSALEHVTDKLTSVGSVRYREWVNGAPVYHKFSQGELVEIIAESDKIVMCAVSEDELYCHSTMTVYTRAGYDAIHMIMKPDAPLVRDGIGPGVWKRDGGSLRAREEAELEQRELAAKFGA